MTIRVNKFSTFWYQEIFYLLSSISAFSLNHSVNSSCSLNRVNILDILVVVMTLPKKQASPVIADMAFLKYLGTSLLQICPSHGLPKTLTILCSCMSVSCRAFQLLEAFQLLLVALCFLYTTWTWM